MLRQLIITKDGSHTIEVPELQVTYHSVYGAVQESLHVFIEAGLKYFLQKNTIDKLRILEVGFGTGLNALLTLIESKKLSVPIYYATIEAFPLEKSIITQLNYCDQLQRPYLQASFHELHTCKWEQPFSITPIFQIHKQQADLINFSIAQPVNLIYYDAFAPKAQPELWTAAIFQKLYLQLLPGGLLVTYCSKGDVRRALQQSGFDVEKITGPPGKREMIRAFKLTG